MLVCYFMKNDEWRKIFNFSFRNQRISNKQSQILVNGTQGTVREDRTEVNGSHFRVLSNSLSFISTRCG